MKTTFLLAASLLPHPIPSLPTYCNTTALPSLYTRELPLPPTDPFHIAVCRGLRLSWAMQLPATHVSQFLTPIDSPFDGSLRDDLYHWGYSEVSVQGHLCDFDSTHHLATAFAALGVDPRSERRGGPNQCFHVQHSYVDHALPVREQGYWVDGVRYRMTGAHFSIGVNPIAGIVFFLNRRSAREAVKMYWGYAATNEQLPALRSSSDIAWGFWNRGNWGKLGEVRAFMSLMVVNTDTLRIIHRVLEMGQAGLKEGRRGIEGVRPWPGTTFGVDDIEGQALLGSPNGLAAGFFLAQHKRQLGGDKVIEKITVFRSEQYGSLPNLLFWVA